MPSPVTNPGPQGYWGIIQSAVAQRVTTAALWQAISTYEQAQGISRPAGMFQAVSRMRSIAASQREAGLTLSKAGSGEAITAEMIAQDVTSRPLDQQALAPIYHIRTEVNVLTHEGPGTRWVTWKSAGYLPATKGELIDLVTQAAADAVTGYGMVFTGLTGTMSITAR